MANSTPSPTYVPHCQDCMYDLTGLPDGRCPECGLSFTHAYLRRLWDAKQELRNERRKARIQGGHVLFVLVWLIFLIATAEQPNSFFFFIGIWTVSLTVWLVVYRDLMLAHGYLVLLHLLPIAIALPVVATAPHGGIYSFVLGALAVLVSWIALRSSPLFSAAILLFFVVFPTLITAGAMYINSSDRIAHNWTWSDYDQPTIHGWQALPAVQSRVISIWIIGVAVALGAVVLFYARRARVRLRTRSARNRGQTSG